MTSAEKKLCEIIDKLFEAYDHFECDPFANGIVSMGIDEGSIRGREFINNLRTKYDIIREDIR